MSMSIAFAAARSSFLDSAAARVVGATGGDPLASATVAAYNAPCSYDAVPASRLVLERVAAIRDAIRSGRVVAGLPPLGFAEEQRLAVAVLGAVDYVVAKETGTA